MKIFLLIDRLSWVSEPCPATEVVVQLRQCGYHLHAEIEHCFYFTIIFLIFILFMI